MPTHFQECDLGYTFKTDDVFAFFGNIRATLPEIEKEFPQFNFSKVKQTHSDIILKASAELHEADAHWTVDKKKGLLISTADCTPVMIHEKTSGKIASVHAGWRGVENQIVLKSLISLAESVDHPSFEIWMGPHILQKSFEVQADVLDLLLKSSYATDKNSQFVKTNSGFMVDLKNILESQIFHSNLPVTAIHALDVDTKTDLRFHSFRRDKANSGRNLSFITSL
ncbi:MAG: polyphenol oxidase family protein [Bdellovibrio sp.]|nr:polyphenol oxidase family protein [Bdellovibrio sp.]